MYCSIVVRISAEVAEVLLPILNCIKTDLNNLNELYSNLNTTVSNLEETVSNLEETVSDLNKTVEDHKRQTTSEHTSLETFINNPPTNVIAIAVLVKLLPYLNNIEENLCEKMDESTNSLTEDLSSLNGSITEKVCNVSDSQIEIAQDINETVSSHMEHLNMKLISSMRQQHREIESHLEQHNNYVNSELIELETNQDDIDAKLDLLDTKQDELNMKVMSFGSELEQSILSNVTEELKKTSDGLHQSLGHICGGEGGWRRVVYLNMTDHNADCPTGWQLTSYSKRTCGSYLSCDSVFFPVTGGYYTRVCGTIKAYQVGHTDAFEAYHIGDVTTIDGPYVSGVSLTHGSPRQHIWTFAAGASEDLPTRNDACPCDATISINIPPFVGGDYFCESGVNIGYASYGLLYTDDPLWDGKGCTSTSTCCEMNNPPYFTKKLPNPTTDDIEARLCRFWDGGDDTPIEFIELYVK